MFWIFSSLVGLTFFAVTLGQYSVWYALLKVMLFAAMVVIIGMAIALILHRRRG
ncbi:MAG: hypothetical protein IPP21_02820 [Betaproteobacteria bacterium]|jgi:hypothetical protein|nr:hypothetical protein [Betaproteobacteria bacterium]